MMTHDLISSAELSHPIHPPSSPLSAPLAGVAVPPLPPPASPPAASEASPASLTGSAGPLPAFKLESKPFSTAEQDGGGGGRGRGGEVRKRRCQRRKGAGG